MREVIVLTSEEKRFISMSREQVKTIAGQFIRSKPSLKRHKVLSYLSQYLVFDSKIWRFCKQAKVGAATIDATKTLMRDGEEFMLVAIESQDNALYSIEQFEVDVTKPAVRFRPQFFYDLLPEYDMIIQAEVLEELIWIHARFLEFCGRIPIGQKVSKFWRKNLNSFLAECPIIKVK